MEVKDIKDWEEEEINSNLEMGAKAFFVIEITHLWSISHL